MCISNGLMGGGCSEQIGSKFRFRFIFPLLELWMAVERGGMSKYETLKNFEDPLIEPRHTDVS